VNVGGGLSRLSGGKICGARSFGAGKALAGSVDAVVVAASADGAASAVTPIATATAAMDLIGDRGTGLGYDL
jgi:hypothetical protein